MRVFEEAKVEDVVGETHLSNDEGGGNNGSNESEPGDPMSGSGVLEMMRSSKESNEAELGRGVNGDDGSGEETGNLLSKEVGEGWEREGSAKTLERRTKRERKEGRKVRLTATP